MGVIMDGNVIDLKFVHLKMYVFAVHDNMPSPMY